MSLLDDFPRVTRGHPCPVCGKADWCLARRDGSEAICQRIESRQRFRDAGWLHVLRKRDVDYHTRPHSSMRMRLSTPPGIDALAHHAITRGEPRLHELAENLGVSAQALARLQVGWHEGKWSFPMCDSAGRIIGVRLRFPNGGKISVKGGREGLFLPTGLLAASPADSALLLPEGASDTAAILDLGFEAVGRPNDRGGFFPILGLIRSRALRQVVVVADHDPAGIRGATLLAQRLRAHCADVRIIAPPRGIKDAREWKRRGATHADLARAIAAAAPMQLSIRLAGDR